MADDEPIVPDDEDVRAGVVNWMIFALLCWKRSSRPSALGFAKVDLDGFLSEKCLAGTVKARRGAGGGVLRKSEMQRARKPCLPICVVVLSSHKEDGGYGIKEGMGGSLIGNGP